MAPTDWEQMLVDRLVGYAPLAAVIGRRVHPLVLPQHGALPAVVYTVVDDPEQFNGHHGRARVQLTAWAESYAVVKQVRDLLRDALRSHAGASATTRIRDISVATSGPAGYEPETGLYRRDLDAMVLHVRRRV